MGESFLKLTQRVLFPPSIRALSLSLFLAFSLSLVSLAGWMDGWLVSWLAGWSVRPLWAPSVQYGFYQNRRDVKEDR